MEEWNGFGGRSSSTARDHIHHHDQEFEEEDVWDFPSKASSYSTKKKQLVISSSSSSGSTRTTATPSSGSRIISSVPRNIPRGSQTTANDDAPQQSSAPMNIPDWSKIYGKKKNIISCGDTTSRAKNYHHHHHHHTADYHDYDHHDNHDVNHDDVDDGDGDGIVPPHEWIAKKLARSQISSFSVCEGIGRTLKGRDLSKVRNAILTKTGFLE